MYTKYTYIVSWEALLRAIITSIGARKDNDNFATEINIYMVKIAQDTRIPMYA